MQKKSPREKDPFLTRAAFKLHLGIKGTDGLQTAFMPANASINDVLACLNLPQNNTTIAGECIVT